MRPRFLGVFALLVVLASTILAPGAALADARDDAVEARLRDLLERAALLDDLDRAGRHGDAAAARAVTHGFWRLFLALVCGGSGASGSARGVAEASGAAVEWAHFAPTSSAIEVS